MLHMWEQKTHSFLKDQIVLITGASSGIGAACARVLSSAGAKLILIARRQDCIETLYAELNDYFGTQCLMGALDVRDFSKVKAFLEGLPPEWASIDILINNAGLSRGLDKLYKAQVEDWEEMIDTNIKGLLYMTRLVVPEMVEKAQGHVINIGSLAGLQTYPGGNVYCASKAAVRAIAEGLKQDLLGTPVRVTTIHPGLVKTEFSQVRFRADEERAASVYKGMVPLTAEDVAEVVYFCLCRPPHVNISEITLMPTDQASSTLVHRQ